MEPDQILPSPNGQFRLEIFVQTGLQSHEIRNACIYGVETGELLFYGGSLWDASGCEWSADSRQFSMNLRFYEPGTPSKNYRLVLEMVARTAVLSFENTPVWRGSFHEISERLYKNEPPDDFLGSLKRLFG